MKQKSHPICATVFWAVVLCSGWTYSQTNSEVFLVKLTNENGELALGPAQNISNNPGYDNQPSFYNDNVVLYASTRNQQTDIARYAMNRKEKSWISDTPRASEYSPLKIPGKKQVSAIRLEEGGRQRLYSYPFEKGKPRELLPDLRVGYHVWYDENVIVCTVLVDNRMDLVVANLKKKTHYTLHKNVGRSLHKIPNSPLVSFISREEQKAIVKSLDPISGTTRVIAELPEGVQDYCWLLNGKLLAGQGNQLLEYEPGSSDGWRLVYRFIRPDVGNITRLAVNSLSTTLALVAEASSEVPVQAQLEAYNAREIEAFLAPYTEDIRAFNYPNSLLFEGKEAMRDRYSTFFEMTPDLHCELKNRIIIGDKVIDEELVTVNGMKVHAVAIYEVKNGKITKVTFIR